MKKYFTFLFLLMISLNVKLIYADSAKDKKDELKKIKEQIELKKKEEKKLEKQEIEIKKTITTTQKQMVKAAKEVKDYEKKLNNLEKELNDLKTEKRNIKRNINRKNDLIIKSFAAIEKIAKLPKGYFLTEPKSPSETIKTAIVLNSAVEKLQAIIKEYEKKLLKLKNIEGEIETNKKSIKQNMNKMKDKKDKISSLLKEKKTQQSKLKTKKQQTKKKLKLLVNESKGIEDFLKKAKAALKKYTHSVKDENSAFYKSKGKMSYPAVGNIIEDFNVMKDGIKTLGIKIKTRDKAQITSPSDGHVMFAGSFKKFNNLVIIEYSKNYHLVLGGINDLYVDEGRDLLGGEPIGEMGDNDDNVLYVELRYKGKPINPKVYFKN